MNAVKDQFEYRPATETLWDPNTGEFISAEEQDRQNALGGYYSAAAKHARKQRARVVNMLARQAERKTFSKTNLERLQDLGYGPEEIISQVTDVVPPGTGTTYTGPKTSYFDPGIAARTQHPTERARTQGGYTDPGKDSYGPWKAEGGRIGYQTGELVEDENIEGPGYDENILEIMKGENIPYGEQVEADPFQMRIQELMGKGLSWEDAYDIAAQEFQHLFSEGPEQDQGIASLV
tara:strand:- start:31 stop:735 length:705 start_codon:yes stop_codon:yes gene_type:complete